MSAYPPTLSGPSTPGAAHTARSRALPRRWGPSPRTTVGVPHRQLDEPMPAELHRQLLRRLRVLPFVALRPSVVSDSDEALGLVLSDDLDLPEPRLAKWRGGREFAQIHGDGSLHVVLAPRRAREAISAGWAERHPLAEAFGCEGFSLLFIARSEVELNTVIRLLEDAYTWWTGMVVPPV
jgi:Family of unknown function (DUF5519)